MASARSDSSLACFLQDAEETLYSQPFPNPGPNSYVLILSSLFKTCGLQKKLFVADMQASEVFSSLLRLRLAVLSSHPCGVILAGCDAQICAEPGVGAQQLVQLLLGLLGAYR